MKKIIAGAVVGGFVYFLWSGFYWAASGIPIVAARTFADEAAVEKVLVENAKQGPGFYVLPTPNMPAGLAKDAQEKFMNDRMNKIATGFFCAGSVRPGGSGMGIGAQLGLSLLFNVITGGFLSALVVCAGAPTFGKRFCTLLLALAAGATGILCMQLVWWGWAGDWLGYALLDWMFGWTLASLAIAKITG